MRREGFLLVWAAAALAIVMTLGAGVFLSVSVAARREAEREISLDETLIAQDAMEQMKASVRLARFYAERNREKWPDVYGRYD